MRFWIDSTDKSRGGYHQEIFGHEVLQYRKGEGLAQSFFILTNLLGISIVFLGEQEILQELHQT
ncbi:hypothetical protein [Microcoleus sp. N3A4]|uniref:hypothetical protein n=1 Tax=Microcoleus sp. N3A4 TaxID=3055379 RepID=UPI002FD5A570